MTPDRPDPVSGEDDETFGVLDESATLDEVTINILGETVAQVNVALPDIGDELDNDDDVIEDEVEMLPDADEFDDSAKAPALVAEGIGVIHESADTVGIVIEIPAEVAPPQPDAQDAPDAPALSEPEAVPAGDSLQEESHRAETFEGSDGEDHSETDLDDDDSAAQQPLDLHTSAPDGDTLQESVDEPSVATGTPDNIPDAPQTLAAGDDESVAKADEPHTIVNVPNDVVRAPLTGFGIRALREYRAHEEGEHVVTDRTEVPTNTIAAEIIEPESEDLIEPSAPHTTVEDAVLVESDQHDTTRVPHTEESRPMTGSENRPQASEHRTPARTDNPLAAKRLGELGERDREGADRLTADRLLDPHRQAKRAPEGTWPHMLYTLTGHLVNIGDSKAIRERKDLTARIGAALPNGTHFIPVLSRKGGVGKTTVTALLGMALADAREDRVVAVDANPDRGTLADRVERPSNRTVRDLVRIHDQVQGFADISAIVSRDATRLDVLASDSDPHVSEAFGDDDYRKVAAVAARYYSLVLTDTGTGIVHSVMDATLDAADQIVIVAGMSVDQARLASETLTWLETNGHRDLAREAIVVLNHGVPGASPVRVDELEAHFASRARSVVRIPYDAGLAAGSAVNFAGLREETRKAARELAAAVIDGLRTGANR